MHDYRPPQQTVTARVYTGAGWLEGTFHLARLRTFPEYLSHHTWYPVTNVVMARVGTMPFLALTQQEALLVAPTPVMPHLVNDELVPTKATLLFPGGAIDGTLDVPAGLRLSDFVARTVGFLPARDANVRVWTDPGAQFFESVLVNPARLVGVTEPEVPR
jgi:hypothetical protein